MKKNRNKGFTLIELLIVMLISLLLVTMVLLSYNVVNNANVQKSARRFETIVKTARVQSMAKGTAAGRITLTLENGNLYAVVGDPATATSKELICNGGVKVRAMACTTDYTLRPTVNQLDTNSIPATSTISFNTNGTRRGIDDTTVYNKFIFHRGSRSFEVIRYDQTGAVEVNMF